MKRAGSDADRIPRNRYIVFFAIALIGCAVDLLTKSWVFHSLGSSLVEGSVSSQSWWLIDEVFGFETSLNEGALFGVGQGLGAIFIGLSIVAALAVFYWLFYLRAATDGLLNFALACVTGGILGNLYDRLGFPGMTWAAGIRGHHPGEPVYAVRDWLHFKVDAWNFDWPIFNLADCLLVCGAGLLIWHAFRGPHPASATSETEPSSSADT